MKTHRLIRLVTKFEAGIAGGRYWHRLPRPPAFSRGAAFTTDRRTEGIGEREPYGQPQARKVDARTGSARIWSSGLRLLNLSNENREI